MFTTMKGNHMLPGHDYGWTRDAPASELRRFIFKEVAEVLRSSEKKNNLTNRIVKVITDNFIYARVKTSWQKEEEEFTITALGGGVYNVHMEDIEGSVTMTERELSEMFSPQSAQRMAEEVARNAYDNVIMQQAIRQAELNAAMALLKSHRPEKS